MQLDQANWIAASFCLLAVRLELGRGDFKRNYTYITPPAYTDINHSGNPGDYARCTVCPLLLFDNA